MANKINIEKQNQKYLLGHDNTCSTEGTTQDFIGIALHGVGRGSANGSYKDKPATQ